MEVEILYRSISLRVEYYYEGKHYPATRDTPAEYPELIVKGIFAEDSDINLIDMLDWKQVEEIENLIDG